MKLTVAFLVLVASCGALLGQSPGRAATDQPPPLLQELVRMTETGSSEAEVLAHAQTHRLELPPRVSDADLAWLSDSGVSRRVISYMSAFDVRATEESAAPEGVPSPGENSVPRRGARRYLQDEREDYGLYADDSADVYSNAYPDRSFDAYCGDCDSDSGYGYGYYPYYGYGYGYPSDFFAYPYFAYGYPYSGYRYFPHRRFHRRDHRFHGPRRFDGGHGFRGGRGAGFNRFAPRDAWRARGFAGNRGGPRVVGPRGSARPGFAGGGFGPGPRGSSGRMLAPRGSGRSSLPRGGFTGGARAPRPGFGNHGGFNRGSGRPSFSGGGTRIGGGWPGSRGRR